MANHPAFEEHAQRIAQGGHTIARGFSSRLRPLTGFGLYRRLLGHIDRRSPVDLLDGVGPRRVVGE